jgi:LPS O-antigen subunit length determinant protein (WzzB/FepE family)
MTEKHVPYFTSNETNEISLRELWQLLIQYKVLVLGVPLLFTLAAFAITSVLKPQWEAVAVLQIGKVVQRGMTGENGLVIWNRELIEPANQVIERMKLDQFQDDVLNSSTTFFRKEPLERLYHDSIKASALSQNLIEIKIRGYSKQEARDVTEATVDMLRKIHSDLTRPHVQRLNLELKQIKQQIENIRSRQSHLLKAGLNSMDSAGDQQLKQILISAVISQQDRELGILEQTRTSYEEQLGVLSSYPTTLVADVYVNEIPVAPKKVLIIATMGLSGLFFAFLITFFINAINTKINNV